MSEHPFPVSRASRHGHSPEQGDRSGLSLLRSFDSSPDASDLVTGPRSEPPRHLEVTWSTDERGHLDAAIVGDVTADNAWQPRQTQTCTQTLCLPGGDPSGDDAVRMQPAHRAADPDPAGCPPTPIGVPEETS